MAESATLEQETSEWAKLTPEQQETEVSQAVESTREKRVERAVATGEYRPEQETPDESERKPVPDDETPVGDDAAKTQDDDAEKGAGEGKEDGEAGEPEAEASEWLDQETRDFAAMMGLSGTELSEFGSKEELERALRIIDRKAFEAGTAATPKAPETPSTSQALADAFADLQKYKVGDDFDEGVAKPLNSFVDAAVAQIKDLQNRLGFFEQQGVQTAVAETRREASASLQTLGYSELFGKPGETLTPEQAKNIERAIDAHFVHARGLLQSGRQVAPTPQFLRAAVNLEFGDELKKIDQRRTTDRLRKQSAKKLGGSSGKTLSAAERGLSSLERLKQDPEIDALWNQSVAENHG